VPTPSASPNDPASEPTVIAVAKVLPAVVNINTERVVRRRVRDPFEDFAAQYFGNYRSQPREIRQTLQSLGSGFIVDPAGYIVTNEHVVQRAADLKIEVTTSDGKVYNARYITGDPKKDLAFIKIEGKTGFPFISLDNLSPNLLGQTVIVLGNAVGYGSSISRGVLSGMKRDVTIDDFDYKNLLQTDAAINPGNSGGPVVDIPGRGVLISAVEPASPADEAGIERGLVIYRIGRHNVNSIKALEEWLSKAQSGSQADFVVGIARADGPRQLQTVSLTAR